MIGQEKAKEFMSQLFRRRRLVSVRTVVSVNIFVLLINTYVLVMQVQQNGYITPESYFASPLTPAQDDEFRSIFKLFISTMESANVTYTLSFGTLLGSLRHHGKIPWDDDIDISIWREHSDRMEKALKFLEPNYQLYKYLEWPSMGKWKFYKKSSSAFLLFPYANFRWPYIDIFFFEPHNSTHEKDSYYSNGYVPKKVLYPLRRRPYEGLMLPAPCNSWGMIKVQFAEDFDPHLCQSRSFSHLMEFPIPLWRQRSLPCSRLSKHFPFVYTSKQSDNTTVETLKIGSKVLKELTFPDIHCSGVYSGLPKQTTVQDSILIK